MGQTNSTKKKKQIPLQEDVPQKIIVPPFHIGCLSLHSDTFSTISLEELNDNGFGVLSQLPREIITIIIDYVVSSSSWTNLALVSKSIRIIFSEVCQYKCRNMFGNNNMEKCIQSDMFFKNRWDIFFRKYRNMENLYMVNSDNVAADHMGLACEVCLYGDHNVGKTSLIQSINSLMTSNSNTQLDLSNKHPKIGVLSLEAHPTDTEIPLDGYLTANIIFLVFDVTRPSSLEYLRIPATILERQNKASTRAVLVGNKIDLQPSLSAEWKQHIMAFADHFLFPLVMCSATQFTNMYHLVHLIWSYPFNPTLHRFELSMEESMKELQSVAHRTMNLMQATTAID